MTQGEPKCDIQKKQNQRPTTVIMSSCDLKNSTTDKITQIQDELINHGVKQREKIFTSHMWLCSIIAALRRSLKTQWST